MNQEPELTEHNTGFCRNGILEGDKIIKAKDLTDAFLKWSEMMDRRRKQNFSQVFPEWCKVLEQNGYKYQYK